MKNNCWWGRRLAAACALVLGIWLVVAGGARADYVDCGICHLDPTPGSGAKDYVEFFVYPQRQHPIGVAYPVPQNPDYFRPTTLVSGITFFDTNGNGVADLDEIQLFGAGQVVECASCHREHGSQPPPPQPNMYLRVVNGRLCAVCHRL